MPYYYHLLDAKTIKEIIKKEGLPVLPIGSLEQHCEAPTGTDALIAEGLAARACLLAEKEGVKCVILPTIYYGFSPEWSTKDGTITLSIDTIYKLIRDITKSLKAQGSRKLAIINGHGGNSGLIVSISRQVHNETGIIIGVFDYWRIGDVRLGHCDSMEEALLSDLLGITLKCNCREKIIIKKYRITRTNQLGQGVSFNNKVNVNELINALAKALIDFVKYKDDPVL